MRKNQDGEVSQRPIASGRNIKKSKYDVWTKYFDLMQTLLGRHIASGHNLQIAPWQNIASQQSLLLVKIFCPDITFWFFYISSRRNIVSSVDEYGLAACLTKIMIGNDYKQHLLRNLSMNKVGSHICNNQNICFPINFAIRFSQCLPSFHGATVPSWCE